MYLDVHVKIPEIKGLITRQCIKDTTYINYEYDRIYDKKRKFNIPKRTTIGKLAENGLMIPNENFHKYLPDEILPGEMARSSRSSCLRVGTWFIIRKIMQDYKFHELLGNYFSSQNIGLFLDLMCYSLICENNAGQYYPNYTYNHPLFTKRMKMYSDSKVSDFLNSLTDDQSIGFLNAWNENRKRGDRIYISYDSTNKNSQAGDLEIVEYGKAKNDQRLPIFNYSIAYDRNNREPLFYEEYSGSIVDVSQLQFMLEKAKGYGYRNVGFILDRGYFSKGNVKYLDKSGYDFVLMVKGMARLVGSLILANKGTFETKRECRVRTGKAYGKTVKGRLYADDTKDRYFHIYHSSGREYAEREAVETKIDRITKYLKKHEGKKVAGRESLETYFELYFDKKKDVLLFAREKSEVIERELTLCGYFVIVTSEQMTAVEALILYKSRDDSEKLFRGDKSYLGNKSLRVCSDESASAKIFIEFVSLIVRNKLYTYLKSAILKKEKKYNFMTVPAAIRELEKIEMIRRTDNIYRLDHAVTATQKAILSAFGLGEDFVKDCAEKLSEQLKQIENV